MYNPHPKEKNCNDCVKRAICAVTGRDYMDVQRSLNRIKRGLIANGTIASTATFRCSLVGLTFGEINGWKRNCDGIDLRAEDRMTAGEFCRTHPTGKYILHTPEHWVACVNGKLWDTFDSTNERIMLFLEVEKGE